MILHVFFIGYLSKILSKKGHYSTVFCEIKYWVVLLKIVFFVFLCCRTMSDYSFLWSFIPFCAVESCRIIPFCGTLFLFVEFYSLLCCRILELYAFFWSIMLLEKLKNSVVAFFYSYFGKNLQKSVVFCGFLHTIFF